MANSGDLIHRYRLPRCIRRGFGGDQSADLSLRNSDGSNAVMSGAVYNLYAGSKLVFGPALASVTGPGEASVVLSPSFSDESLSDRWLEVWTVTIDGGDHEFTRPVNLVRYLLNPVIDDTDLYDLHTDLAALRDPDDSTFERQRVDAWIKVQTWLIQKGNRPQLIVDDWQLADLHRAVTLWIIFTDFATSVGDGRYSELSDKYKAMARETFDNLQLSYDYDEDGTVDPGESKAANPVTYLTVPWSGRYDVW